MLRKSNLYDVTTPSHRGEGWGGVWNRQKNKNINTHY